MPHIVFITMKAESRALMLIQLFRSIAILPGVEDKCVRSLRSMKSIAHYLLALLHRRGKTTHAEVYAIMLFTFTICFQQTGAWLPWELFTTSPISHKRVSSIQYDPLVRNKAIWHQSSVCLITARDVFQNFKCIPRKSTWILWSGLRFRCTPERSQLVWGQSRNTNDNIVHLLHYIYHNWWSPKHSMLI